MSKPKEVTAKEALAIVRTRNPIGCFWQKDGELYIGIDNTTGDAWVEEFTALESCLAWLEGRDAQ